MKTAGSRGLRRQAMQPPLVIWTRGLEDWQQDFQALPASLKDKILHLPCTAVTAIKPSAIALKRLRQAVLQQGILVICTSPKSGKIALASKPLDHLLRRATYWLTFGATTTRFLRGEGIKVRRPRGCVTSTELFRYVRDRGDRDPTFVVLRAKDPAYDLGRALTGAGMRSIDVILYKTLAKLTDNNGKAIRSKLRNELRHKTIGVVAFASPSAVRGFVKELAQKEAMTHSRLPRPMWRKNLIAVCIGPTTAAAARKHFADVRIAKKSNGGELARAAYAALQIVSISP